MRVIDTQAGIHTPHGGRVRFPVRVGDLQMAIVAKSAEGEAARHMGL